MPTDRQHLSVAVEQPKLDVVRLEDRLTPATALTADTLLSFTPNPVLDFGTTSPTVPLDGGCVSTSTAAPAAATPAPAADPVVAGQYELVLPTTGNDSTTTDSSGGTFALFSIVPPPPAASLSGYVYVDEGANGGVRDDGIKQAGEPGIPGATVTLLRVVNGVTITAASTTTDSTGFYSFPNLSPFGEYQLVESQPAGYLDGKDTPGTVNGTTVGVATNDFMRSIVLNASDTGVNYNFGELLPTPPPGALSGYVYQDEGANGGVRDDGIKQAGEPGIAGTTVTLFRVVNGVTTSIAQTTTDSTGFYQFTNLPAGGGYLVRETQPAGFLDGKDTAGSTGGSNAVNDDLSGITVPAGGVSINNNFGELLPPPPPAQLSGFVYVDADNDGVKDTGEAPIPGTVVVLFRIVSGVATSIGQTSTDANGFYSFTNLPAGTYEVRESQPAGFLDGKDTPGSTGGSNATNDVLTGIPLVAGANSVNNNFGELLPARLSGFEYEDLDDDGVKDANELGIPGVTVVLTGTDDLGAVTRTAITGSNGGYAFTDLRPGTYTVAAAQPSNYLDGKDTPGSTGGSNAVNDVLSGIPLVAGANSVNNNFGEIVPPGTLSGFVYVDEGAGGGTRDDGIKQAGEPGIQGTVVTLFRVSGGVTTSIAQTTTDATGFYQFTGLAPGGGYLVREAQPATFLDGKDTPGTTGGSAAINDELSGITIPPGGTSQNNNFGELLPPPPPPGSLSGFVYEDNDDDGVKDVGEAGIAGTTLTLIRVVGGVTTSLSQTTTDGNGFYQFSNLTPGDGYRVVETQPTAYADGKDTPGSTGGNNTVNDVLSAITVPVGGASTDNNFGERLGQLSGFVYLDEGASGGTRDDGIKQAGEPGIAGVSVTLFRVVGGVATSIGQTVTDANGFYSFTRLAPGTYEVRETQPTSFQDGKDTPGAGNGATTTANDVITTIGIGGAFDLDAPNNNFGELLLPPPPPVPAQLSGYVYVDEGAGGGVRNDGIKQSGEPGIAGATVTLFRIDGGVATSIAQAVTDSTGFYSFTNLVPGTYEVRETQPANFADGKDTPGSTGGSNATNDVLTAIPLASGANSVNNNFGELVPPTSPPPPPGALSGYVYVDANDNGIKEAGEAPIPGTIVRLTNGNITLTTTTDASGFYQFTNLTPGNYTVLESQPAGYLDGLDTPGSTGGNNSVNDVLSVIPVPAGGVSVNNNFGELLPVSLYGYVWFDANRSGTFDPSEIGLGGATVTLTGTTLRGLPVTTTITTTDAFGRYAFTLLPPGVYTVVQSNTPAGYIDFKEENAARLVITGGSTPLSFSTFSLTRDAGPLNFGKVVESEVVVPPTPSPQRPGEPSKQNFLGSTSSGTGVTVPPSTPGQQLPIEAGPFNPSTTLGPTGASQAPRLYAVSSAPGTPATVRVFDTATGGERFRLRPFEEAFLGGATVTIGDVNGDGIDDVIVAAGAGGGPRVSVFNGDTGARMYDFYAYDQNFTGGVYVASGDVDDDGYADIITGAGAGGGPHVKVFSGRTGQMIQSFYAFDQSITGGVRVAAGDFNGDGRADIATATGAGVASQIATYDALSLTVFGRFQPFESAFLGGVNLAAGDVNGDGIAEVIAGAASGGGPRVKVMNATNGAAMFDFYAASSTFTGGVSVAARDLNADGKAEIVTGTGAGVQSTVQVLSGVNLAPLDTFFAFESANKNGIFVG